MGLNVATTVESGLVADAGGPHAHRHRALEDQALEGGGISAEMAGACVWSDEMVAASGISVRNVPFVTVGGGVASYAMVDALRISGVPASMIAVVGPFPSGYGTLKLLLEASQIDRDQRLRSGSSDRMGSIWGWPGYGLKEAFARRSPATLARLVAEPVLCDYFTPKASALYEDMDAEARRISWQSMFTCGRVPLVRRRDGGGYFIVIVPAEDESLANAQVIQARYVHLGIGFVAAHVLDDMMEYRSSTGDARRVVNVYEPHEHIYEELARNPGKSVLVRGSASSSLQVIERLVRDRDAHDTGVEIYHLFRTYVEGPKGPPMFRIPGKDGFSYQAFTFTKACYGGQLQRRFRSLSSDDERAELLAAVGSTAVPKRKLWRKQSARGKREGWYKVVVGSASGLELQDNGRVRATISQEGKPATSLEVDYVIDATGVEVNLRDHEVIADLLDCCGAETNAVGQLAVNDAFEVSGTRNGNGKIFASGVSTLGNPYVIPMYSFWGLQYAALLTCKDLSRDGFCQPLGIRRSVRGWWHRIRNSAP